MIECENALKKNNLEIVGFWDSVFYSDRKDSSGVIVQDKNGNKKCLSWAEIKKMSDNDNISEKGMLKKSEKFNTSEEYVKSDNLIDEITAAEITQEATKEDIGKICCFWDNKYNQNAKIVGCLYEVSECNYYKYLARGGLTYKHCRRLTKQEIEELC